jgi:hypothetical protein
MGFRQIGSIAADVIRRLELQAAAPQKGSAEPSEGGLAEGPAPTLNPCDGESDGKENAPRGELPGPGGWQVPAGGGTGKRSSPGVGRTRSRDGWSIRPPHECRRMDMASAPLRLPTAAMSSRMHSDMHQSPSLPSSSA